MTSLNSTVTLSDQYARFGLSLQLRDVPRAVQTRAKHLILDAVGIALASRGYTYADVSFAAFSELGSGASPVIGFGRRLALRDQLRCKKMPQVMKPRSCHLGAPGDRAPDLGIELVRVYEVAISAGKHEALTLHRAILSIRQHLDHALRQMNPADGLL